MISKKEIVEPKRKGKWNENENEQTMESRIARHFSSKNLGDQGGWTLFKGWKCNRRSFFNMHFSRVWRWLEPGTLLLHQMSFPINLLNCLNWWIPVTLVPILIPWIHSFYFDGMCNWICKFVSSWPLSEPFLW